MNSLSLFPMRLSLQVSVISTILVVVVGVLTAYMLARKEFRGREFLDMLVTLPLVMPPTVTGYYLIVIFGRNGLIGRIIYEHTGFTVMFSWYAAVLASFVVSLPLMVKIARAAIESVDRDLIDASYTLGRSEIETVFHVVLPLAKRGIIAGAVLSFARGMGEFGATLMLAGNLPGKTDTMPIAIYSLVNSGDWSGANVMVAILTVSSGIFLYIANRYSVKRA